MTRPVAALTGASGFLGRRLAQLLDRDGWRVRALVRRPLDMALWDGPTPELVEGHLADGASLRQLVAGAELVIHCAGAVSARDRTGFFAANATGAGNMAEAVAAAAPAAHMVLVSSLAAREPQLSDYAASKRAGEQAAQNALPADRLTVIRPPAIYGPGDRATLDIFRLAARSPVLPILAAPGARLALAHVDDVAAEILRQGGNPTTQGIFAIGGARPDGYGWREIMSAAAEAIGRQPRLIPIAPWALSTAGQVLGLAGAVVGQAPMLSPGKVREMLHPDWSVSPQELASQALPAHFDLQAGFADTVAWYRAKGWL